jgi:hypothetical protein
MKQARASHDFELTGVRVQQLRHQSLVDPYHCKPRAGERVHNSLVQRRGRVEAIFEPKAKAVEAPCGRPAEERFEDRGVERPSEASEAGFVLLARQKTHATGHGYVLPIAGTDSNQRLRIVRPEAQG